MSPSGSYALRQGQVSIPCAAKSWLLLIAGWLTLPVHGFYLDPTWNHPTPALTHSLASSPKAAAAIDPDDFKVPPVYYRRDIVQILSKAGCNAGPCHGNANGKGGFKLSLRGEDPDGDLVALTQDQAGRRVHLFHPDLSLLLLKATTALAHEGGQRFTQDSSEYHNLKTWIAAGATDDPTPPPAPIELEVVPREFVQIGPITDPIAIRAEVVFADGTRRDITREAVYESTDPSLVLAHDGKILEGSVGETTLLVRYLNLQQPVRFALIPEQPDFAWTQPIPDQLIDRHIFEKLRDRHLLAAELCSDEVFLRRISLDLLGLLPTTNETQRFLEDSRPDKRARWVDDWLERPEFADFWALKWADLLRVEERTLDRKGMEIFHRWLRQALASNLPMDQFVREIVSAKGSTYTQPPANFYRANRTPIDRGLAVAQVFLGTRLNCAECHNHPFDRWSQDDYHDWAAVFSRVNYKVLRNDRRDNNDSHEFKGEQIVYLAAEGKVNNPRLQKPATPRFLGETEPIVQHQELDALAEWLVAQPNFAQVQVNRIWAHLMGRGLVDPVDDFRATNPASHPALLQELAAAFKANGHDLRYVIRLITGSWTYQMSSTPHPENYADDIHYSHTLPRRLAAEPLLDIQRQVTRVPLNIRSYPTGLRSVQMPGGLSQRRGHKTDVDSFLEVFGKPPRLLTCDCERATDTTMAQAFYLINGPTIHEVVQHPKNILSQLLIDETDPTSIIETLYWTTLTRAPSALELEKTVAHLNHSQDGLRPALEDLLWSLLNAKEFILRH